MIPEIVVNKVYWYIWKMKQREICKEYSKRVNVSSRMEIIINVKKNKKEWIFKYNWRNLEDKFFYNIYNYNYDCVFIVGKLPKNYVFSGVTKEYYSYIEIFD